MPYVNGLGNVSWETAMDHHRQQEARHWGNSPDWINDQPVSEFAKLVEAECFRTGKSRQKVMDEYRQRQREAGR